MVHQPGIITVIANQKGGVGKTTTAVNLGAFLAREHGWRVLLVDLDPQGNASTCLECDGSRRSASSIQSCLLGLVEKRARFLDAAIPTQVPRLHLVPASPGLGGVEVELANRIGRESMLKEAIAPITRSYDHILIDTSPTLGLLTLNALACADNLIIPVECQYLALKGLSQFLETVKQVRQKLNPSLRLLGVLPTKYAKRYRSNKEALLFLTQQKSFHTFSPIPRDVRAEEYSSHKKPLLAYAKTSRATEAYRELAQEVVSRAG